jgi:hypothetical protein
VPENKKQFNCFPTFARLTVAVFKKQFEFFSKNGNPTGKQLIIFLTFCFSGENSFSSCAESMILKLSESYQHTLAHLPLQFEQLKMQGNCNSCKFMPQMATNLQKI